MSKDILAERKLRSKKEEKSSRNWTSEGHQPMRVLRTDPTPPEERACSFCFAQPGEDCVSMTSGKKVPHHQARYGETTWVERFRPNSNRLTEEGVAHEMTMFAGFGLREDRLAYDPPDDLIIGEDGAYVTFIGSNQAVDGAHSTMKAGHTYFAKWAPNTKEGFDKHGRFLVHMETERGPVWLFPYEYVVLAPMHLWHLVKEGELRFVPKNLSNTDFGWKYFYCLSRGIKREDALVMCLSDIHQDVGYFEPVNDNGDTWWRLQSVGLTPMQKEEIEQIILDSMKGEEA